MNEQILKDFLATLESNSYDYDSTLAKFPELADYDVQLLKDYAATAKANDYNYEVVNPKFPEFNLNGLKKKRRFRGYFSNGRYGFTYTTSGGRKYLCGIFAGRNS